MAEADPVRVMASGGQDADHLDEVYDGHTPDVGNAFVIVDFPNGCEALDLSVFAEGGRHEQEITVDRSMKAASSISRRRRGDDQRRDDRTACDRATRRCVSPI